MNKTFFMNILAFLGYIFPISTVIQVWNLFLIERIPIDTTTKTLFPLLMSTEWIIVGLTFSFPILLFLAVIELIIRKLGKSENKLLANLHKNKQYKRLYYLGLFCWTLPVFVFLVIFLIFFSII